MSIAQLAATFNDNLILFKTALVMAAVFFAYLAWEGRKKSRPD